MKTMTRAALATATTLAAISGAALMAPAAQAEPGTHDRAATTSTVAQIRQAIRPYQDVTAAVSAGYIPVSDCEMSDQGGMGYHYLNPSLVTVGGTVDPTKPTILLYGPDGHGGLELLGAEFFQPDLGQPRPELAGEPFNGPMAGHSEGMPTHYDLHVWTNVANPAGVFSSWNPAVTC
ncbi:hypothetical protein N865_19795 [Intrasporangium oryzae NRRL B-24470]|uniref:Uncharacterized protein n=1 Tax=Intrasporangium oryzae NRRL B-24470 TaxID=1386089 RepID=W9G1T4_9MICO|nr:hypothetical protein [Intrasporangium oryzae]EWS99924.1 hypothetical protein N865_19795 [Intrasporangium oryzae NRRL B-24470]